MIPNLAKKLYFVNNALNDSSIGDIMNEIAYTKGLKCLGVIKNAMGSKFFASLTLGLWNNALTELSKFILKDQTPY